ncbi:helix-turn-helix domain-containing protein [Minwuia sp. IMCC3077]|uniref:helix-turn-helix domain-containing protein n=1 Tax=Minwuia sp. IMCC3077 TaxID=3040676 RepID=UPI00247854BD|nr:helix-turn-helix domain-containing protein [Minwuia sp. IMCC3077]
METKSSDHDRKTYTVTEMAAVLGIGRTAAYEAVRTGQVPALKIGKRVVIPRAALERLLSDPADSADG